MAVRSTSDRDAERFSARAPYPNIAERAMIDTTGAGRRRGRKPGTLAATAAAMPGTAVTSAPSAISINRGRNDIGQDSPWPARCRANG